jgi:hypothetical protein
MLLPTRLELISSLMVAILLDKMESHGKGMLPLMSELQNMTADKTVSF